MKIGLIGYGKMGKAVEKAALEKGHEICGRLTSKNQEISQLAGADVCIDFTDPDAVWETVNKLAPLKKNIVIGTTGWEKYYAKASLLAREASFGLLYAPNFSIGMYIFEKLAKKSGELMKPFDFDVAGVEMHHSEKKDAPSGSGLRLSGLLSGLTQKEVPFTSVRCGKLTGIHQVIFNSGDDTIELTHRASSRAGFASGAVAAAQWLEGKVGSFTFDDFMKGKICN